jgi:hypothetical protein
MNTDYLIIQKLIAEHLGLICQNFKPEVESQEYGAAIFELNDAHIIFRIAKITPTKIGQFVTFWKRIGNGPIMPFDGTDAIDFFMISVRSKDRYGLFVFPKSVLLAKNIMSEGGKGGKRAIRVYPSWDVTDSKQARATQAWQVQYFIEISLNGMCDKVALRRVFDCITECLSIR